MRGQEIVNADVVDGLRSLSPGSIDLIIADPPYNLGKDYGNNQDRRERAEYIEFSSTWLEQCQRVLKPTGTLYVFMGFRFISYLYEILEQRLGMHFRNWIVWHYTQGSGKTRGFSPRHDDILVFTNGEEFKFNLDAVRVPQKFYRERNNMRGANPGDVWEFSHVHYCSKNRQGHATQKPEALIERMVLASSDEEDAVLDLFSGSGTTLRVCQQLERHCMGFEINPTYVEMIKARLAASFEGFDSVDPRMQRVPLDLRSSQVRDEYVQNHERWFLKRHSAAIESFRKSVDIHYPSVKKQESLFEV